MKHWSAVFVHSLLCGAVFGSSDLATDCISTHLLPVITTSVSVPGQLPTDLMPEATGAIPVPGSNQPYGPGGSAPGGSAPGASAPGASAPGGSAPGGSAPGGSAPGGSVPGSSGSHANQDDTAKPTTASMDAGVHSPGGSGQGSGYDNPNGAATTPLSSANPQLVSGALDLRPSKLAKTAFVVGSVALIVQMASLV